MDNFENIKSMCEFYERTGRVVHLFSGAKTVKGILDFSFMGHHTARFIGKIISHEMLYIFQYTSRDKYYGKTEVMHYYQMKVHFFEKKTKTNKLGSYRLIRPDDFIKKIVETKVGE